MATQKDVLTINVVATSHNETGAIVSLYTAVQSHIFEHKLACASAYRRCGSDDQTFCQGTREHTHGAEESCHCRSTRLRLESDAPYVPSVSVPKIFSLDLH